MIEIDLGGDVAVVTGAASGIGRATARRLAAAGAAVVVADIDAEGGERTVERIRADDGEATFVETDVTDPDDVGALFDGVEERYGGLDALVSNAGTAIDDGNVDEVSGEAWAANLELNLTSHFRCTRAALGLLAAGDGGSVVYTSSINATIGFGLAGYTAAKGGLRSLSRLVAVHYGRHGVRANAILPGTIDTAGNRAFLDSVAADDVEERLLDQFPLGRFGEPREVADAALFLVSPMGSFVTGSEVVVDGGMTAGFGQELTDAMFDVATPPGGD